jgi:hypothetical protein
MGFEPTTLLKASRSLTCSFKFKQEHTFLFLHREWRFLFNVFMLAHGKRAELSVPPNIWAAKSKEGGQSTAAPGLLTSIRAYMLHKSK